MAHNVSGGKCVLSVFLHTQASENVFPSSLRKKNSFFLFGGKFSFFEKGKRGKFNFTNPKFLFYDYAVLAVSMCWGGECGRNVK